MASTPLVRSWDASCMDRRARSTAMTSPAGSVAVPVASACEAAAPSVCRSASAPICLPRTEENPPPPASVVPSRAPRPSLPGSIASSGSMAPSMPPTVHSDGSAPAREEGSIAGIALLEEVEGLGEHALGRLHRGDVGLVGAGGGDQVDHLGDRVDVRHRDVAVGVGVRMAGVVDE